MAPAATMNAPALAADPVALKATLNPPVPEIEAPFDPATLFVADKTARESAAKALAQEAKTKGPTLFNSIGLSAAITKALGDKKSPATREAACGVISVLCEEGAGKALEPIVSQTALLTLLLETFADKTPAVKTAALDAARLFTQVMSPWATALVLPPVLHQIKTAGKWQVKAGCLALVDSFVIVAPEQTARLMPELIPILTEVIWDTKAEVKKAARATLTRVTALVSNKDIEVRIFRMTLYFAALSQPILRRNSSLLSSLH
jgi:elongation factor 3